MAAPVFTERLAAVQGGSNQSQVVYTAPAGVRVIVRDLVLSLGTGSNSYATVSTVTGSTEFHLFQGTIEAQTSMHLELRQALSEGDTLNVYVQATSYTFLATGYVFNLT